jgi:zinc protease
MRSLVTLLFMFATNIAAAQDVPVRLPSYSEFQMNNGVTVLLMEQHEVPIVNMHFIIRESGSSVDFDRTKGLASLTADLLRKGTRTRTARQISNDLDRIGGEMNFNASLDYTSGSAEFLAKDVRTGLDLVADVLRNPVFPEDEVSKLIRQRLDEIKSAKDRADRVIGRYFYAYLYKSYDVLYSRPVDGDESSLPAIKREDVQKFYAQNYRPGSVILAVTGDFKTSEMRALLEQHFASWSSGGGIARDVFRVPSIPRGKHVLLVDKPDSTQTYFNIGYFGISRTNPDRVAIAVVNTLFGGRFTSRLNSALRINSGLTYGARSTFDQLSRPGPFVISSYTRNATTEKAIDMTLQVLSEFHQKGITQSELDSAKAYLKGQFPLSLETTDRLASTIAQLEFYNLDASDIDLYSAKIDALTLNDTRRIIEQYLPLDNLFFVLIGKASEIQNVARKYAAAIETKSITEPGF